MTPRSDPTRPRSTSIPPARPYGRRRTDDPVVALTLADESLRAALELLPEGYSSVRENIATAQSAIAGAAIGLGEMPKAGS